MRQSAALTSGSQGKAAKNNATLAGSALRDEGQQAEFLANADGAGQPVVDALPINLAFSHSGLQTLQLDEMTLNSFSDVFKDGMAARADRLGNIGPSAPENWEEELGARSIHGYFSGGFQA